MMADRARAVPVPRVMIVHITDRCQLSCVFCDLPKQARDMSLNDLERILKDARSLGIPNLVLTGGEPLLHPDLGSIFEVASSLGFGMNITTNGINLADKAALLARHRVHSVSVSIDGTRETHDTLRARKGAFDAVMAGIEALKRDAPEVALSIYMVATEKNAKDLDFVYRLACDLDAEFNFWPVNNQPDLYIKSDDAKKAYADFVDNLAEQDPEFARRKDYYMTGLRYHAGHHLTVRCLGLVDQIGIGVDGSLLPCCVWGEDSLVVGNAVEQGLVKLLGSQRARDLRKSIRTRGCTGLCYNHSLYEFSQMTGEPFLLESEGC